MAVKATIFKIDLNIADMDRAYYANHILTVARHPSETDERMMVRIAAFAFNAGDSLSFARGLSDVEEPELWARDDTGAIQCWIEAGQPDGRRLLKAAGRSKKVIVYSYGNTQDIWLRGLEARVRALPNLDIVGFDPEESRQLAKLAERNMAIHCTIDDGQCWFGVGDQTVALRLRPLLER